MVIVRLARLRLFHFGVPVKWKLSVCIPSLYVYVRVRVCVNQLILWANQAYRRDAFKWHNTHHINNATQSRNHIARLLTLSHHTRYACRVGRVRSRAFLEWFSRRTRPMSVINARWVNLQLNDTPNYTHSLHTPSSTVSNINGGSKFSCDE